MTRDSRDDEQGRAGTRLPALRSGIALALLLSLLAVVAAAAGGGRSIVDRADDGEAPQILVDYAFTVAIVAAVAVLVGVILVLLSTRRVFVSRRLEPGRFWIRVVLGLALVAVAVLFARFYNPTPTEDTEGPIVRPQPPPRQLAEEPTGERPDFRWEVVVIAAAGLVALAFAVRRPRAEEPEAEPGEAAEAVSLVLDEALDDLRAERDARRAVIAAYARLEHTLARHGLARRPSEAPLEYLSRILLELEVAPAAVLDLTELFEQAKFSRRRIDEAMKDEAIDALVAVRDDLRVAA